MKPVLLFACLILSAARIGLAHPEHEFMAGLTAPSPATVLLITPPELAEAWKPFAVWKKRIGKPVRILSTSQIAERYEAPDLQEKIRRCIRNHTDHLGTRWIILGGDSHENGTGGVPDRDTLHRTKSGDYDDLPTDIYYLSKKDWDSDNDGIYGEWEDDRESIDYPDGDVGLGRIPVRTAEEVRAYTDKVIAYESGYPGSDFATSMAYTCSLPSALDALQTDWDAHLSKVLKGGLVRHLSSGQENSKPFNSSNWINLLNSRESGKIHMHGGGLHHGWLLEDGTMITANHVAQLRNEGAYPFITTTSCFTGEFDRGEDPSIGESMIRHPKAGAIAIVAPSRDGRQDGTHLSMTRFWEHGLGKKVSAGAAIMLVKADLAPEALKSASLHFSACSVNLLGDPTLGLRGTTPRTPRVAGPKKLPAGNLSLVIESDAPHSIVSLQDDFGLYAVTVSDESGNVVFPLNVVEESTITITVSGPEYNAVTLRIPVQ